MFSIPSPMKQLKILFAISEKDSEIMRIKEYLEKENHSVSLYTNAINAIQKAKEEHPHVIIICMKNDLESIDVCFQLRENTQLNNSFIIIISTQSDIYLQVTAYNSGADDFIQKPFNARVIFYKIKSITNRGFASFVKSESHTNLSDKFIIDREQYLLKDKNGKEILLPRKEFELLFLLMTSPKKVFKREEIISYIWQNKSPKNVARAIDVHIRRIREKIGNRHIKTVKGIGYSFQP